MYDVNEKIETKWSTRNKKYYMDKGYHFTGRGTQLIIAVKDLPSNSNLRITAYCDCPGCGAAQSTPFRNYNRIIKEYGIYRCKPCAFKIAMMERDERSKQKIFGIFLERCAENNCIPITTIDEYNGSQEKVKFICPKHGEQEVILDNIVNQGSWCYWCGKDNMKIKQRLSTEEVIRIVESKNGNKLLNPEDYQSTHTINLKVRCGSCGKVRITSLSSISYSQGQCLECANRNISTGERKIKEVLDEYNIKYTYQEKYEDCKDKHPLPFDYFLPQYNTAIEYDGRQHYEPIPYWGGDEGFEIRKSHDEIKNKYCLEHDIHLLRIPYWEENNIQDIITSYLKI